MAYPSGQIHPAYPDITFPTYQRPADWLSLPRISPTEEKFAGLFPVFNVDSNFIALLCEGDYTVDWGDGTIEDFASGVKAQHSYDYATISNSTLCSRGYKQVLISVTPQAGQELTFLSLNAVPDDLNSSWRGPWLDYILSMPNIPSVSSYSALEVKDLYLLETCTLVALGELSDLDLFWDCLSLQTVYFPAELPFIEDTYETFSDCYSLKFAAMPRLPVTDFSYPPYMTYGTYSLEWITMKGLPSATSVNYMFSKDETYSYSLSYVAILETPQVTDFSGTFYETYSLRNAYIPNMSAATHTSDMFDDCYSLLNFYVPETPVLEFADYMFSDCYSLSSAKLENLSALTSASNMFSEASCLSDLTLPPTPSLEQGNWMFDWTLSLNQFPLTDTSSLLNASYMLSDTNMLNKNPVTLDFPSLENASGIVSSSSIALFSMNAPSLQNIDKMARFCYSLQSFSLSDASSLSFAEYPFGYYSPYFSTYSPNCGLLSKISVPGISTNFNVSYCLLSRDAIVDLFNDLGLASATIDVSNNYGTPDLTGPDIAIATGKGWTVIT